MAFLGQRRDRRTFLCPFRQDVRLWPHCHPYGTGSVRSEPGSGGLMRHTRNRTRALEETARRLRRWPWLGRQWPTWRLLGNAGLCQIQSFFRRSSLYQEGVTRSHASGPPDPPISRWHPPLSAVQILVAQSLPSAPALLPQPQTLAFRASQRFQCERPKPFVRWFGSAAPNTLPESAEWWRRQGRELFCVGPAEGLVLRMSTRDRAVWLAGGLHTRAVRVL